MKKKKLEKEKLTDSDEILNKLRQHLQEQRENLLNKLNTAKREIDIAAGDYYSDAEELHDLQTKFSLLKKREFTVAWNLFIPEVVAKFPALAFHKEFDVKEVELRIDSSDQFVVVEPTLIKKISSDLDM